MWLRMILLAILTGTLLVQFPAEAQLGPKDGAELPATDLDRVQVGSLAPDFSLRNWDGAVISLSESRGKEHVVLVFYRGHW